MRLIFQRTRGTSFVQLIDSQGKTRVSFFALTPETQKNFSTYKDEYGQFFAFICKTVYERFSSIYLKCCIHTSQFIIFTCFCKV